MVTGVSLHIGFERGSDLQEGLKVELLLLHGQEPVEV